MGIIRLVSSLLAWENEKNDGLTTQNIRDIIKARKDGAKYDYQRRKTVYFKAC